MGGAPLRWIRIGQQRGISSQKGGTLNVSGLLNLRGDLTSHQTAGYVNSQTVIGWIDDFAAGVGQTTVIVLDNAPRRRSKLVEGKIAERQAKGVCLFFLPPYRPQRNAAPARPD